MRIAGLVALAACCFLIAGCSRDFPSPGDEPPVSEQWQVMGTYAGISLPGSAQDRLTECVEAAAAIYRELDATLSVYKSDSEISRLNQFAGIRPVAVSSQTSKVIQLALDYAELTDGSFEPTVVPLVRLWGFSGGATPIRMPEASLVDAARRKVDYRRLILQGNTAYLEEAGMGVDLGGIAKGYAVDTAYSRLLELDVRDMLVDLGGNMRCRGRAQGSRDWKVGVRNPFVRSENIGVLALTGGAAVATSGNYERFVVIDGERFSHIIDPRTGYPARGLAGVTVISDTAVSADALSTALFVMGADRGMEVLARLPECQALFVPDSQPLEIWITPGFRKYFTPNPELENAVKVLGD